MPYWSAPPEWSGHTAFLVLGGPSVADQNLELLRGRHVIAVNSSFERVPWAEFLFFGDTRWWRHNRKAVLSDFVGRIVTTSVTAREARILPIKRLYGGGGLSSDPSTLAFAGSTSTQPAVNLAVHLGVKRIVLLGLDMEVAPDGRIHHHTPHPWPQTQDCFAMQIDELASLVGPLHELGIEVVNTSPVSPVIWWPKASLEECLSLWGR